MNKKRLILRLGGAKMFLRGVGGYILNRICIFDDLTYDSLAIGNMLKGIGHLSENKSYRNAGRDLIKLERQRARAIEGVIESACKSSIK